MYPHSVGTTQRRSHRFPIEAHPSILGRRDTKRRILSTRVVSAHDYLRARRGLRVVHTVIHLANIFEANNSYKHNTLKYVIELLQSEMVRSVILIACANHSCNGLHIPRKSERAQSLCAARIRNRKCTRRSPGSYQHRRTVT